MHMTHTCVTSGKINMLRFGSFLFLSLRHTTEVINFTVENILRPTVRCGDYGSSPTASGFRRQDHFEQEILPLSNL